MEQTENDFLSIKEFALLISVHPNTIRRAIKNGRISGFKVGGGKRSIYRIPRSETNRMALCDLEKIIDNIIKKKMLSNG